MAFSSLQTKLLNIFSTSPRLARLTLLASFVMFFFLFVGVSDASAATKYWFNSGADSQWTTRVGNWWDDINHTMQSAALPGGSDNVITLGATGPTVNQVTWTQPLSINATVTGITFTVATPNCGCGFTIAVTGDAIFNNYGYIANGGTLNGNATFNNSSYTDPNGTVNGDAVFNGGFNTGVINGDVIFNNNTNNSGDITGSVTFNNTSSMNGLTAEVIGNAVFNDSSINNLGVITGDAVFNDSSKNALGTVTGDATFNDSSYSTGTVGGDATFTYVSGTTITISGVTGWGTVSGTALNVSDDQITDFIFDDESENVGTVVGSATFNDSSTNEGTVTLDAIFNDVSENQAAGTVNGDAFFYDSTLHDGAVDGDACFALTATNSGTVTGTVTACAVSIPTVSNDVAVFFITATTVGLSGLVEDIGGESASTVGFHYGTASDYGSTASLVGDYTREAFISVIRSLSCDTTYHYRTFATNSAGTGYGSDATFTTGSCLAPVATLYGVDGSGSNSEDPKLYAIDPLTGDILTTIGDVGFNVTGLAFSPVTGILYGGTGGNGNNPRSLITINTTTGAGTYQGTIRNAGNTALSIPDIAFHSDGTLYGFTGGSSGADLYTIDLSSCNGIDVSCLATKVGVSGLSSAFGSGLAFDNEDQLFEFPDGDDSYYELNSDTGAIVDEIEFTNPSGNQYSLVAASVNQNNTLFASRLNYGDSPSDLVAINLETQTMFSMGDNEDLVYMDAIAFSVTTPTVTSSAATAETDTTATLHGTIVATGGATVTERGFNWGLTSSYGTNVVQDNDPYAPGDFSTNLSGLECGATYHYRAYATNAQGTNYSVDRTFDTSKCTTYGTPASQTPPAQNSQTPVDTLRYSFSHSTGTLILSNGTIYLITAPYTAVGFTSWAAFTGLGYKMENVIQGDLSGYYIPSEYFFSSATQSHPWSSWVQSGTTIYYVSSQGLIGVPTWEIFVANGGLSKDIVPANANDLQVLKDHPNLQLLGYVDTRVIH